MLAEANGRVDAVVCTAIGHHIVVHVHVLTPETMWMSEVQAVARNHVEIHGRCSLCQVQGSSFGHGIHDCRLTADKEGHMEIFNLLTNLETPI